MCASEWSGNIKQLLSHCWLDAVNTGPVACSKKMQTRDPECRRAEWVWDPASALDEILYCYWVSWPDCQQGRSHKNRLKSKAAAWWDQGEMALSPQALPIKSDAWGYRKFCCKLLQGSCVIKNEAWSKCSIAVFTSALMALQTEGTELDLMEMNAHNKCKGRRLWSLIQNKHWRMK